MLAVYRARLTRRKEVDSQYKVLRCSSGVPWSGILEDCGKVECKIWRSMWGGRVERFWDVEGEDGEVFE